MTAPALPGYLRSSMPETAEVYVLGPLEAPLLRINAYDDEGCLWFSDEPEGWGSTETATTIDRRQDGDGGYGGVGYLVERTLTFDGVTVCPTLAHARRARQRLAVAVQGRRRSGQTLYTQLNDDPQKSLWVRPTGRLQTRIVGTALEWSFIVVAEDPIKFGPTVTYGPGRLPTGTPGGRTYPRTYPVDYGEGSQPGEVLTVRNDGDEAAPALFRIVGPVPSPRVYLLSGEYIGLTVDLGPLDEALIDTRAGTLRVNGTLRADALPVGATFPRIPAGGTEVRLRSATGGSDPAASLYVTTAPAYL